MASQAVAGIDRRGGQAVGKLTGYMASILDPEPHLEPMYGCKPFTPATTCRDIHHRPIRFGSHMYCEACGKSGCDHWRALKRDPKSDPKPEGKKRAYTKGKLKGGTEAA